MKTIKCEMCGSNDVIKSEGYYVCQSCGTKYSVEEAKKLLIEISDSKSTPNTDKGSNIEKVKRPKSKKRLVIIMIVACIIVALGIVSIVIVQSNNHEGKTDSNSTEVPTTEIDLDRIINDIQSGNYNEAKSLIEKMSDEQFAANEERIMSAFMTAVKANKLKYNGNVTKLISDSGELSYAHLNNLANVLSKKSSMPIDNYYQYIIKVKEINKNYNKYKEYIEYFNSSECQAMVTLVYSLDYSSFDRMYANVTSMLSFDYSKLQSMSNNQYCNALLKVFMDYMGAAIDYMDAVYNTEYTGNGDEALKNMTQVYTRFVGIVNEESDIENSIIADYNALPTLN